jgi:2-polyprenyl-3-methyl-5-hydroxy-6-metoxy-1,4-benzoquinol methylase
MTESTPPAFRPSSEARLACPVCACREVSFFHLGFDRLFGLAPGQFSLYRCDSCRCIFQFPIPDSRLLSRCYPDDYWWSGQKPATGLARFVKHLEQAYRDFVVRDHVRFLLRCARRRSGARTLLDIGCGSGSFLSVAHRHGFSAFGMDQSPHAVAAARNLGLEVRQGEIGSAVWEGRCFDYVSMFHIIEHLPDPRAGLRYAAGLLNSGGCLLIQVPNVASAQARIFGRRWYGLDVPRHVINFSPAALTLLLEETGLQIQDTARFSLRDNPASIASSIAPWMDPIGRHGRRRNRGALVEGALESAYFGMVLLALVPALVESAFGCGGTLWISATRKER